MRKNKLNSNEKAVIKTAIQCVALYAATVAVIHVLGRTQTQPYED